jgi:uncharacterized membrane protein YqjE
MVIAESVTRLAATFVAVAQNRVQLAATEIEEESLRYFSCLLYSLAAMFCVGMAVVLGVLLVVVLFWETHRTAVLLTLVVLFGIAGAALAWRVWVQYRLRPGVLSHSIRELSRDQELLRPPV